VTRLVPSAFEARGKPPLPQRNPRMRVWSVRHAALIERVYARFEAALMRVGPIFARIGYNRLERPAAAVEAAVKGLTEGDIPEGLRACRPSAPPKSKRRPPSPPAK